MEFFRTLAVNANENLLHCCLTTGNLERFTNMMFPIGDQDQEKIEIGSVWGEFTLLRSEIKGGVRFALKECPNALAWTVTAGYPPAPEGIVLHLSINRIEKGEDLVNEIGEFLDDHLSSLQEFLHSELIRPCAN